MSDTMDWMDSALGTVPVLSKDGVARRDEMRKMLQAAVVARWRRRLVYRLGAAAVLVLGVVSLWPRRPSPDAESPGLRHMAFEAVRNDPGVLARCSIDDDELLELCREVGRPTGLIRIDDRVILTGVDP